MSLADDAEALVPAHEQFLLGAKRSTSAERERAAVRARIVGLQLECQDLLDELEERDRTITALRREIAHLRGEEPGHD